jgi:hypothetical protein
MTNHFGNVLTDENDSNVVAVGERFERLLNVSDGRVLVNHL